MSKLHRFAGLSSAERRLFLSALLVMGSVRISLLFFPVHRVARALDALNERYPRLSTGCSLDAVLTAKRIAQAARLCPVRVTCLSEALAAKALMARYGHAGEVRIGVRKRNGKLDAHAWLECASNIVIGDPSPQGRNYVRLRGAEKLAD